MNRSRDHEQNEQRQMKDVPKREQPLVKCQRCRFLHRPDVKRDVIGHEREPLTTDPMRPSKTPALIRDNRARLAHQTGAQHHRLQTDGGEQKEAGKNAFGPGDAALGKRIQRNNGSLRRSQIVADDLLHDIGVGQDFPDFRFPAVKPDMDLAIEIAADDATDGNDKHGGERHVAVDGAQSKIRMKYDQQWPNDAEHHVGPKPEGDGSERAGHADALSQGVKQQQDHQAAARYAEQVSKAAFRRETVIVAFEPADAEDGSDENAECNRDDTRLPPVRDNPGLRPGSFGG